MIDAITFETAHVLGDVLPALLRFRYRTFVERQSYEVPTHRRMEWDQFDNPATVYLVWRDENGQPRAAARLIPTTFPYMIKELWPDLVDNGDLPTRSDVWEISRLGVDRELPTKLRTRVMGELLCALVEFANNYGIRSYLSVTRLRTIQNTVLACGGKAELLGSSSSLGRFPVVAARTPILPDALTRVRRFYGITGPVLRVVDPGYAMAA